MKKFLLLASLCFFQCHNPISQYEQYKKFVTIKDESSKKSKIVSCSLKPFDDDTDLSHYEIFGFAHRNGIECGTLKVAFDKKGRRLNYQVPLSPNKGINIGNIYMPDSEKDKFENGKTCKFRMLLDNLDGPPNFMLKNGVFEKYSREDYDENNDQGNISVSILIKHQELGKVHKSSGEIVLSS